MKSKKLKLAQLEVCSFVTKVTPAHQNKVNGGDIPTSPDECRTNPVECWETIKPDCKNQIDEL